ncbi:histone acetyltransferases subunit 3-domain-containing protein [Tricharina praecox]|uniref:histone acetyltransferases subunit 3-domain-containing protein n=1 Tax=Tricharina praecox TaxID=43433 RepID=UPI00221EACA7|nr:histone acetyltransferases subunit 3-domain-containing protein [Tricharina praecox]KAI5850684.1 histone acetyltransferases subunit 3-domain-containing protein [Tricharina praecox]
MSAKGAKGKGKSRGGGGMNAQGRRSLSRNTTPASGSAFSGDTISSEFPVPSSTSFSSRRTYDDLFERLNLSENPSIPNSGTLVALRQELGVLKDFATERLQSSKKALFAMKARREERAAREKAELAERESERKAVEDAEKKEKIKLKKRKAEPEHKRPLAVGAHQVTGQGPNDREKKKKLSSSPEIKRDDSEESEAEHQPTQAAPFVVFEPLDDDPAIYEIATVTDKTPYAEKAKAFAVARFPEDDLSKLIPGYPPDEDFSKAKPTNQVGITTFNAYIEPYFRPFSEEDLAFLRERGDRLQPYIIPKLGKHYSEQWAEEDGAGPSFASPAPPTNSSSNKSANAPRGKPEDLSDEQFDKEEVSCGPLLARLLSLYIPEEPEDDSGDTTPVPKSFAASLHNSGEVNWKIPTGKSDYSTLDERVRREMVYVGLLDPSQELDYDNRQDDEVSARLRQLQKQLKEQAILNGARKTRIAEQLKEQLAYQEYVTILEDLDKQVEQAFAKRSRNMKASKKKKNVPNGVGVARAHVGIGEQARLLMERRRRWVDTIGPVFDKDLGVLPESTIFERMKELLEKEKLEAAEEE